ncbi:MAG TPA: ATPase domain-containing protein [Candidatus Deferrimicrobium sp.]|nr:ATPase domain-containing protein [Candidatus Deferrimicrobium sp.]
MAVMNSIPPVKRPLELAVETIRRKYPANLSRGPKATKEVYSTGIESFDRLFPGGGIPSGQLIEITGATSCGKTSLLFHILAGLTKKSKAAYIDIGNMFFSDAAACCGVALPRLVVVKPRRLAEAIRTTELVLRHKLAGCVVCDLVGQRETLPMAWFHRLRAHTVRCRGIVFFITENNSQIIPPSMVSMQLEVSRRDDAVVHVRVSKSRISPEGVWAEVRLDER